MTARIRPNFGLRPIVIMGAVLLYLLVDMLLNLRRGDLWVAVWLAVGLLGGALNLAAMLLNSGKMPAAGPDRWVSSRFLVLFSWVRYLPWSGPGVHSPMDGNTRFPWLCDLFSDGDQGVFSIGDVLILCCIVGMGMHLILR